MSTTELIRELMDEEVRLLKAGDFLEVCSVTEDPPPIEKSRQEIKETVDIIAI